MLTAVLGNRCRVAAGASLLFKLIVLLCVATTAQAQTRGEASCSGSDTDTVRASATAGRALSWSNGASGETWAFNELHSHSRSLLQTAGAATACGSGSRGPADRSAIMQFASTLLGDSRLRVTDARFRGSCRALGLAQFASPHTFAAMFPAAVVLSTGDAQAAAGDMQPAGSALSTDLQQPGDTSIGAYTHDAAVLELDLSTSPSLSGSEQLLLSYLFGSEEYSSKNPNPDVLSIAIRDNGSGAITDLAVLPGGGKVPPPAVTAGGSSAVQVFSNSVGRYRTVFNGFTQVCLEVLCSAQRRRQVPCLRQKDASVEPLYDATDQNRDSTWQNSHLGSPEHPPVFSKPNAGGANPRHYSGTWQQLHPAPCSC